MLLLVGCGSVGVSPDAAPQHLITVTLVGDGVGQVSSNPPGLTCASTTCTGSFDQGTPVTLTASPNLGSTLVPCAPGGSLPFAPRECLTALHRMRQIGGETVWGRYGFVDAFNPQTGWKSRDVIAIDTGIMLVMAENLQTGFVWQQFMRAPEVSRAMELAGFRKASAPVAAATRRPRPTGKARPGRSTTRRTAPATAAAAVERLDRRNVA